MKKKKLVNRFLNLLGFQLSRIQPEMFSGIPKSEYILKNGEIELKRLSIKLPLQDASPLIKGYNYATKIVEKLDGLFIYDKNGLKAVIENVTLSVTDPEELFIINEVFYEGMYNFHTNKNNVLAIDIGMNVGIASLFFSKKKEIKCVHAYELFPSTFELAEKNILLNDFANKVVPHSYGLGKHNEKLKLPFSHEQKARMGLKWHPDDNMGEKVTFQEVMLKNVSSEFEKILKENEYEYVICKIDCEGSEFEILEDLYSSKLIDKVDSFMIEWHYRDPEIINKLLTGSGFAVFSSLFASGDSGMIYAVK